MALFTRHVSHTLPRFCDGEVTPGEAAAIRTHLAACQRCRAEHDDLVFAGTLMRQLAMVSAPPEVWRLVERRLSSPPARATGWRPSPATLAWSAALVLAVAAAYYWAIARPAAPPWIVALGDRPSAMLPAGDWIDTSDGSTARIMVGEIGTVRVAPGTRVQLGASHPREYRLALVRGTIEAEIAAPPRLFIVDTPVSTVVDLGCAYTVTVGEDGGSELRMTQGWAALEWEGRESLVPAGAICRSRPDRGPGLPHFDDAPPALKEAVTAFDAAPGDDAAVATILREARARDTLTLWHLIARVEVDRRGAVFDRIAALVETPASIARDRVLALDPATMTAWREELAWRW